MIALISILLERAWLALLSVTSLIVVSIFIDCYCLINLKSTLKYKVRCRMRTFQIYFLWMVPDPVF